jgi:hypothetical protein
MKDVIMWVVLVALVLVSGYLFIKVSEAEHRLATQESKTQSWDMAVEVLEDCMEYNTLGECKQHYPQYAEQFR